jgi:tRNA (cmo5U34)-methyltransferase
MPAPEWSDPAHAERYLTRARQQPAAISGDAALLELVPASAARILDLGTGDGRLLALLLDGHPERTAVGLDSSELMLDKARERFAGDARVALIRRDLAEPLPQGRFDAIVSSLAIHHLEHARKRSLYIEVFDRMQHGGVFVNFEHVASPSQRLHLDFFAAIDEPLEWEDPSDRLLDVQTQLMWLREIGFEDVDCHWKWRELALLAGVRRRRSSDRERARTTVDVRAASEADWPSIWPFFSEIVAARETIPYDEDISEAAARSMWMAKAGARTSIAVGPDDAIVGSASMDANRGGPGAHVASATYMVDPAHQGRGVGRALVLDSLAWARARGFRAMQFNAVVETNAPAVALYESLGFAVIGTAPHAFLHPTHGYVGLHVMFRSL